eukprot:TRINITY_DN692_c0_g1_i1.p1 TRINITY_DN692_c0_g1~~TRINITY_DN692_c0_g1_i1.p1  ORF type:complete len:287 (-),score=45.17 TRINITY_DN692_c0_g1_i1:65-925(-)
MAEQSETELDIEQSDPETSTVVKKWKSEAADENFTPHKVVKLDFFKSPLVILKNEWRCFMAEFVATMMFVFMTTALIVSYNKDKTDGGDLGAGLVSISIGVGISLSTMIYNVANISGGHLNPAVTIALLIIREIELFKAIGYIIFQILGAIVGTGLMYAVMPDKITEDVHMGATKLSHGVTPAEGCAIEICLTFILVFTVCATAELSGDLKSMGRFAPLAIGYSVLVDHMIGIPFTGASMNPARSFGPAVIGKFWDHHWIYWVGPISGGIIAAIVYHYLFIIETDD